MSLIPSKTTRSFSSFGEELLYAIETGQILNKEELDIYADGREYSESILQFLNTPRILYECPRVVLTFNRAVIITCAKNGHHVEYIYDADSTGEFNHDALIEIGVQLNGHVFRRNAD